MATVCDNSSIRELAKKIVSVVELCKIVEAAAVSCGIQIVAEDLSMQLITTHTKPFS